MKKADTLDLSVMNDPVDETKKCKKSISAFGQLMHMSFSQSNNPFQIQLGDIIHEVSNNDSSVMVIHPG